MTESNGRLRQALDSAAVRAGGALLGGDFANALYEMERSQWAPAGQLHARAEARLADLLRHAAENVPYYIRAYRELGLPADGLRTIDDLRRLPVVDKAAHRRHAPDFFLAANVPTHRRVPDRTSGSTGEPFSFYLDREALPVLMANHAFADEWYGLRPFQRSVRIGGRRALVERHAMPLPVRVRAGFSGWLRSCYEGLTQLRIPAWDIAPPCAEEIYLQLERFRPAFVIGYGSAVAALASELLRLGLRLRFPVRAVIVEAEPLTPPRRAAIEEYFQAPIGNRYGPREQGAYLALSCPDAPEQFHVLSDMAIWEIVRNDGTPAGPGETGRLLLTDLHNRVMPFIRWDTGDLVTVGAPSCRCGRGLPVIQRIEGRSFECLRTVAGRVISPAVLSNYLFVCREHGDAVREYQLVQDAPARARLLIAPGPDFDQARRARLAADLAKLLGSGTNATVEVVEHIPCEPSGKRPLVKPLPETAASRSAA